MGPTYKYRGGSVRKTCHELATPERGAYATHIPAAQGYLIFMLFTKHCEHTFHKVGLGRLRTCVDTEQVLILIKACWDIF